MAWISTIWSEFIGLFVDDGRLALSIAAWLVVAWLILPRVALLGLGGGVAPLILFCGLALLLVQSTRQRR